MTNEFKLTGLTVTLVYALSYLVLALLLAYLIHCQAKESGENLGTRKFLWRLWKMRGVYGPLLIHIYDTATDVGILYEWYQLMQEEKNGRNFNSVNMEQLFWTAFGFMIAYRFVLAFGGFLLGLYNCVEQTFDEYYNETAQVLCYIPLGIIAGALELMIFYAVFTDQTQNLNKMEKRQKNTNNINNKNINNNNNTGNNNQIQNNKNKNKNNRAKRIKANLDDLYSVGQSQKAIQLLEGVLESLPEVVMQSVFVIRSYNDEYLVEREGDNNLFQLIILSIFASIISIANKYIWLDGTTMIKNVSSLIVSKETILKEYFHDHNVDRFQTQDPEHQGSTLLKDITVDPESGYTLSEGSWHANQIIEALVMNKLMDGCDNITQSSDINDYDLNLCCFDGNKFETDISDEMILAACQSVGDVDFEIQRKGKKYLCLAVEKNIKYENIQRLSKEFFIKVLKNDYLFTVPISSISCLHNKCTCSMCQSYLAKQKLKKDYNCKNHYFISYGYLIRVIWRIAAVCCRFIIISLIWAVLGGWFEIILCSVMICIWYALNALYASFVVNKHSHEYQLDNGTLSPAPQHSPQNNNCCACLYCNSKSMKEIFCWICGCGFLPEDAECVCLRYSLVFCGCGLIPFVSIGLMFQLGLLGLGGTFMFGLRICENITLMGLITFFAYNDTLDCDICFNPQKRTAIHNPRVLAWIVIGWVMLIIHAILCLFVNKMISKQCDVNKVLIEFEKEQTSV